MANVHGFGRRKGLKQENVQREADRLKALEETTITGTKFWHDSHTNDQVHPQFAEPEPQPVVRQPSDSAKASSGKSRVKKRVEEGGKGSESDTEGINRSHTTPSFFSADRASSRSEKSSGGRRRHKDSRFQVQSLRKRDGKSQSYDAFQGERLGKEEMSPGDDGRLPPVDGYSRRKKHKDYATDSPTSDRMVASYPQGQESPTSRVWRTPVWKHKRSNQPDKADPMGFRYPMLAVPMGDTFLQDLDPDQSMNTSTKLLMEEWVDQVRMGEGMGSEAIFLETKLLEGLRLTEGLGNPNPLRTAMCCYLLTQVVREMKSYRPMMQTLLSELLKSIYYDPGNVLDSQQNNAVFLQTRPYFTLAHDLDALSKENLKLQREVKLSRLHQIVTQRGNKKLQTVYRNACFTLWVNSFRENKNKNILLKGMMAKAMKGRSKDMLRERFAMWVQAVRETKGDPSKPKGGAKLEMLEKRLAKLQDESVNSQATISTLRKRNAVLEEELSQVRALEEQEQEHMEIAKAKIEAEAMVNVLTKRLEICLLVATNLANVAFKAPLDHIQEIWRALPAAHSLLELGSGKLRQVQGTEASRYSAMREKQRRNSWDDLGLDSTTYKALQAVELADTRPALAVIPIPELDAQPMTVPRMSLMKMRLSQKAEDVPKDEMSKGVYKGEVSAELAQVWNTDMVASTNIELAGQDIEDVVLRWVNLRIHPPKKEEEKKEGEEEEEPEEVSNFTSDWTDLKKFSKLVQAFVPPEVDVGLEGPTPQRCFQLMMAGALCVDPSLNFITVDSVQRKDQDLNAAFLSRLFSRRRVINDTKSEDMAQSEKLVEDLNQELLTIQNKWTTVKEVLDECRQEVSALKISMFDQKVKTAKAVLESYETLSHKLAHGVKWARAAERSWEVHRERAHTFSFDILKNRVSLKSNRLKDAGNQINSAFSKLVLKISDIFPYTNIDEVMRPIIFEQLEFVLTDNTDLFEQVFRYYRDDAQRVLMPVANYRNLCKDIQIMDDGNLTDQVINAIFYEVTKEHAGEEAGVTMAVVQKVLDDPEVNDPLADTPMFATTEQFIELLIWTAAIKYREMDDMLEEKLSRLITTHLIPHARRYESSQLHALTQSYANMVVLRKSEMAMKKKFQMHALASNQMMEPALSIENFKAFLSEHRIDAGASIIHTVFSNIVPLRIKNEEHACLSFEQLQEAICALCLFKNTNPFRPFEQRLTEFIKAMPLKAAARRRAGGGRGGGGAAEDGTPEPGAAGGPMNRVRNRVSIAGKMARRVSLMG